MSISNSRDFIRFIRKYPENFYIIHYSCESLYDDNDSLSPRITSIAVTHFASEQTVSFSTHAVAEELHIERDKVPDRLNQIELKLLTDFYNFVRDRRDKYWIHWNMRNLTYGFEHLQHRYRILSGRDSPVIPVECRINLNDMLVDRYGSDYAPDPKLESLMKINGGIHRDFLSGKGEIDAFQNKEFIRMHSSTLCKVGFFNRVIKLMGGGRLKTYSNSLGATLDWLFETRLAKALGLLGAVLTLVLGGLQLLT